jgi:hypothetical protein
VLFPTWAMFVSTGTSKGCSRNDFLYLLSASSYFRRWNRALPSSFSSAGTPGATTAYRQGVTASRRWRCMISTAWHVWVGPQHLGHVLRASAARLASLACRVSKSFLNWARQVEGAGGG